MFEFGAGSLQKIRLLLSALQRPARFVPIDISAEHLHAESQRLADEHPGLVVLPLAGDFSADLALPPPAPGSARRVGFFPGSSIGNFAPADALLFLRRCANWLAGGGLLVGVDLVKHPALLHAAYNDSQGVTAAFNLNLLARANRELGANFNLSAFHHHAFYEPKQQRIEMHLVSGRDQCAQINGERFEFADGQTLHTENSYKYTVTGFQALARAAGLLPQAVWTDAQRLFSVHWLVAPGGLTQWKQSRRRQSPTIGDHDDSEQSAPPSAGAVRLVVHWRGHGADQRHARRGGGIGRSRPSQRAQTGCCQPGACGGLGAR